MTFYECIYGRLPFDDKTDTLSRQIQFRDIPYPITSPQVSNLCVLAMINLLERDPNVRLGANSWTSFTEHPFFQDLDFRHLEIKRLPPVFRPSQEKSNFDAVYELEELLLEQAPLEGRARRAARTPHREGTEGGRSKKDPNRRPRKTTEEEDREDEIMEMLNQYFEPYDYTRYTLFPLCTR
jgi:serine/threonine kinase 32